MWERHAGEVRRRGAREMACTSPLSSLPLASVRWMPEPLSAHATIIVATSGYVEPWSELLGAVMCT